jgi:hypothetical protein
MIAYDDGTMDLPGPEDKQHLLNLTLVRNEDNVDIASYSFAFTDLAEMYEHTLYLVYWLMANVPLTKLGDPINESDLWRHKWLYLRFSFDYPVATFYNVKQDGLWYGRIYRIGSNVGTPSNPYYQETERVNHEVTVMPGATIGLELQFLNWMSAEVSFLLRFGDPHAGGSFIPGIGLQLKFPLKPAVHFMLEPYIMGATQHNSQIGTRESFPFWAVGGGMQFGVKGGNMGALFFDASFVYNLGDVRLNNPEGAGWGPEQIHYTRYAIGIGIGYKVGFFDRKK